MSIFSSPPPTMTGPLYITGVNYKISKSWQQHNYGVCRYAINGMEPLDEQLDNPKTRQLGDATLDDATIGRRDHSTTCFFFITGLVFVYNSDHIVFGRTELLYQFDVNFKSVTNILNEICFSSFHGTMHLAIIYHNGNNSFEPQRQYFTWNGLFITPNKKL